MDGGCASCAVPGDMLVSTLDMSVNNQVIGAGTGEPEELSPSRGLTNGLLGLAFKGISRRYQAMFSEGLVGKSPSLRLEEYQIRFYATVHNLQASVELQSTARKVPSDSERFHEDTLSQTRCCRCAFPREVRRYIS